MARYRSRTDIDHAWEDNRDQAKLVLRRVMRRLENAVLGDLAQRFDKAVAEGRLERFELDAGAIQRVLKQQLQIPEKAARVSRR